MTDDNTPIPFGFKVEGGRDQLDPSDRWSVYLLGRHEDFEIAGEAPLFGYAPEHAVPHAEAVAELERFIGEAQAALDALRRRHEFDSGREKTE